MDDDTRNTMSEQKDQASTPSEQQAMCNQELTQLKAELAYARAEFDNYRKREERDRAQRVQSMMSSFLLDMITLVDDFERALAELRQHAPTALSGIELIYKNLLKTLEKYGVTEMAPTKDFDPQLHEVVVQVDRPDLPAGSIVDVLQKGYVCRGVLLRPARVSIANDPVI
jgi:molecular chaperone GrpE